jgi:capsular exopolysaccharide synthesis family protein
MSMPNKTVVKQLRVASAGVMRAERRGSGKAAGIPMKRVDRHVVGIVDVESYEAEQYRKLRYVIEEKREAGKALVAGVCSAAAGDGKSLTALNLAGTLAQDQDARVLLVDTDLRRQSTTIKGHLGLKHNDMRGLTDAIVDEGLGLEDICLQVSASGNFFVVLTGVRPVAPYEALRSARFTALMAEARAGFDYVIVDAPPVVPVSDCRVIARQVDGFVVVVSAHRTPRTMLAEALNLMDPAKTLGLVFNRSDLMPYRYYAYYGYTKPTTSKRSPRLGKDLAQH